MSLLLVSCPVVAAGPGVASIGVAVLSGSCPVVAAALGLSFPGRLEFSLCVSCSVGGLSRWGVILSCCIAWGLVRDSSSYSCTSF